MKLRDLMDRLLLSLVGVNFAGYVEDQFNGRREILCRVTGEALRVLANDCGFSPDELMAAYRSVSGTVNLLAAAQYAAGKSRLVSRPSISPRMDTVGS